MDLLLTGVWLALLVGCLDVVVVGVHKYVLSEFVHRSPHVVWMAPIADLVMFVPPAAVLALLAARWPRLLSFRTGVFFLGFPAALSLLVDLLYQRIHPVALLALALGIAVQLARFADTGRDRFRRVVRRTTVVMAALVLLAGVSVGGARALTERAALARLPAARAGVPNVLLLILDTVRSASMELYGYGRGTTPQLERFAERAVVFDNAIAPASWTLPSHASMFTGREPRELSAGWLTALDDAAPTVAEVLRQHGYATAGFVANLTYATAETGLNRGFIRYSDYQISPGQIFMQSSLGRFLAGRRAFRRLVGTDQLVGRRDADQVNQDFLGWLDGNGPRPFFAFLNYFDAHDPYLPPDEFFRKLTGHDRPGRLSPLRRLTVDQRRKGLRSADLSLEIDSYDAAIAYLDDSIGRLLDELERRGVLDQTVVVIASDHGEEFGEHGLYFHGNSLYLPSLHVPLLISYPGGPRGVRVRESVSLQDLARTVVDLAGVAGDSGLGGQSLVGLWGSGDSAQAWPVYSQLQKGIRLPEWYPVSGGDMASVMAGGVHYIRNGDGREELFDVRIDPWERSNLAGESTAAEELSLFRSLAGWAEAERAGAARSDRP